MKSLLWALVMVFALSFVLFSIVACEEEDDDDDDDDKKADDDSDDDTDDDNDDSTDTDDDDGSSGGDSSCGCKAGEAGSCPSGLQMKLYARTARDIFDRNPELKDTAYDILIKQGVIKSLPNWIQTLALDVFSDYDIEPATASSAQLESLYLCGYVFVDEQGIELSPAAAAEIGNACTGNCIINNDQCGQMVKCVESCL